MENKFISIIKFTDIRNNIASYLDFNDKNYLTKSLHVYDEFKDINFILNYDFFHEKYTFKKIYDIQHICNNCYTPLILDIIYLIGPYYNDLFSLKFNDNDCYVYIYDETFYYYKKHVEFFVRQTHISIFLRFLFEYLENNNIHCLYNSSCIICNNSNLKINEVQNNVVEYYKNVLYNKTNIDIFCDKCGKFGHNNFSKECIFYNLKFENHEISREVKDIIKTLKDDVSKRIRFEKLYDKKLCPFCKTNCISLKCISKCCGSCCLSIDCTKHKNK